MVVKKDSNVKVAYEGKLEDGTVFDKSEIEFKAGSGQVIKGFDEAVMGMKVGDEKEVKITPENGYGPRRDELVQQIPKDQFPKDKEVEAGMMISVTAPNGQQFPATVQKVEGETVTLDMNPPLAGKNLNFKLKIVDIN
ncbi:MAG: FKBP-type peptidyl-prolyl cis-trans isomerase [Candidatus Woesearchaeota archaeon]